MVNYVQSQDSRGFGTVGKYIQGPKELAHLTEYLSDYGTSPLFLIDPFFYDEMAQRLQAECRVKELNASFVKFGTVSSMKEIDRLTDFGRGQTCDVLAAIGGGSALDTGKAVAVNLGVPMVMVPTAASCDAPCSRITAVYNEDGSVCPLFHKKNPDLVLVDTEVILRAPVRMLSAGIGDALATWLEARAAYACGAVNGIGKGYRISRAGMAVARTAYEILMTEGVEAYLSAKAGIRTQAFEDVVEANILLSGVGFENTACSIAHGFQASASGAVPEMHRCMHGEKVSYGILVQLLLENRPREEIYEIADFLIGVGLPVTLAELGVTENAAEKMRALAHYGIEHKALMHVEPFAVTEDSLYQAILFADEVGKGRKAFQ